jgi:benzodiazapine receptor
MYSTKTPSWRRQTSVGVLAIAAVASASVAAQIATFPNLAPWYASLVKPAFNPPNWIFAPVWTILNALMAFAVWRILRLPLTSPARRSALTLFFVQLTLNAAWSWMFFGANSPLLGMINIVPQLLVISLLSSRSIGSTRWLPGASCRSRRGSLLQAFSTSQSGG